jgi:cell wall-associated NlpC family hydrolase
VNFTIDYAKSFLGTPYVFGGNNRLTGIDCSGFVCEVLRSAGVIGSEDLSAQMLFDKFMETTRMQVEKAGSIAFYGKDTAHITHVAFHIDRYRVIEAGGGDSTTHSFEDARARGAMVRMRPYKYRKDYLCSLMPIYAAIGLF